MEHLKIIRELCKHGFKAYVVGGAVRDALNGDEPKDYDVVTNAKPEEIACLFPDCNTKSAGKSFRLTFVNGVDVATYRKDRHSVLLDPKRCITEFAETLEEDLERRDLTVNAIAMCEFTGEIIDTQGGISDLEKRIVRFVGDPVTRIKEDPNRIIRACRFLAKMEGEFDKKTLEALCERAYYVKDYVGRERVRIEILKAMDLKTPSLFFSALHLIGALKYIFPELDKCFNHPHGKFHVETIGEHLMAAGDYVSPRFPLVRLAAFLHDVGKPDAYRIQNDGSFVAHEAIGYKIVGNRLRMLGFSNREVETVSQLVRCHMLQCRNLTDRGIRRLRVKLAEREVDPRSYLRLKLADRSANMTRGRNKMTPIRELVMNAGIRGYIEESPLTVKDLAISGGQIIELLNLKPGPIVGEIQRGLLEVVVDYGNEFNTFLVLREYACILRNKLESKYKQ